MVHNIADAAYKYDSLTSDRANLDDIMLFYVHKGEMGWS